MQTYAPSPEFIARPADPAGFEVLLVNSDLIALALVRGDTLVFANAAFCRLFGRTGDTAGTPLASLIASAHRDRLAAVLRDALRGHAVCVLEGLRDDCRMIEVELHARALNTGNQALCAIFAQDVTDRLGAAARLDLLAFTDPLSGLANRALFAERLRQAALDRRRDGRNFGLVILDLDDFSQVNQRHGRDVGDAVLRQVAQRILECMPSGDTVARLRGDEFGVLLPDIAHHDTVADVVELVLASVCQPIIVGSLRLVLSATAGIAVFPEHGQTVEHLMVAADAALHAAKHEGGGGCGWAAADLPTELAPRSIAWSVTHEVGVAEMDEQHTRLAALLNDLATALRNGQNTRTALGEVVRYAAYHFACEERMMALAAYPDAAAHRDLHQRLLADISGLALEGQGVSTSLLLRYLQEWLFRHVDGPDRALAATLLRSGQASPSP